MREDNEKKINCGLNSAEHEYSEVSPHGAAARLRMRAHTQERIQSPR